MFTMLVIAFGHDCVARQLSVTAELHVFFCDCLRCPSKLHVWAITVQDTVATAAAMTAAAAATVPAVSVPVPVLVVILTEKCPLFIIIQSDKVPLVALCIAH